VNSFLTRLYSGWYDPLIQNLAYLTFATNAPGYGQLVSDEVLQQMNASYFMPNGCKAQEEACYAAKNSNASNAICSNADDFCVSLVVFAACIFLT
jgi:carboxypeptidase C (cathepsin A)